MRPFLLLIFLSASFLHSAIDPGDYGFSPTASPQTNTQALQKAVDQTGTIQVATPGIYDLADTVLIPSDTSITFGPGVRLRKSADVKPFTHLFLNQGALTKTWDENIAIHGLHVIVNEVDHVFDRIYGLRGQIAFFYVRDLRITGFRCYDLGSAQYGIHVCTFANLSIEDTIIHGNKDGIHLGRGKRFTIRDATFKTRDDAIALNAHDYATSNPELGWIEDGVIENCYDLNQEKILGFFCRILAGAWIDWKPGMIVQQSDTVVSDGRLYRVQAKPDGTTYVSKTRPTHTSGAQILDDINWGVVQDDVTYTAGVRNVTFRDIFLHKPRLGFSVHFDNDHYSRSYYPGAPVVKQERLLFDNIRVVHDEPVPLFSIGTPVDVLTITNSTLGNSPIVFQGNQAMEDYLPTFLNLHACTFTYPGPMELIKNTVPGKAITLQTIASAPHADFQATLSPGPGTIQINSDLPGIETP